MVAFARDGSRFYAASEPLSPGDNDGPPIPPAWIAYCDWLRDRIAAGVLTSQTGHRTWVVMSFLSAFHPGLPAPTKYDVDDDDIVSTSWRTGPHIFVVTLKEGAVGYHSLNADDPESDSHEMMFGGAAMNNTISQRLRAAAGMPAQPLGPPNPEAVHDE
jgi:hypothetical protein